MRDEALITGLLAKREELNRENAELRERMAILANDIEAIDRVLDSCGFKGELEGRTPRAARIVLFYRNELRDYLLTELRKSPDPLTARQLACLVCQTEGKDSSDRRLITDVTRRVGSDLRKMRASRMIEGQRTQAGQVWRAVPL